MLRRIPIAVIHAHGPSIRQRTMFAIGVRMVEAPKRATTSSGPDVDVGVVAAHAEQAQDRAGSTPDPVREPAGLHGHRLAASLRAMRPTYHLVPAADWAASDPSIPYAAASLADEGFIHCTDGDDELLATANRHYRDDERAFLVLTVDLDAAGSPWRIDDPGWDLPARLRADRAGRDPRRAAPGTRRRRPLHRDRRVTAAQVLQDWAPPVREIVSPET